jgi:DNA-binding NtrC family response regulator
MVPFSPSTSRLSGAVVLLIDEDSDFREALAANLREDGCVVHCFDRVTELPDLESMPALDLLVTDAGGGVAGGVRFAEWWHRTRPHVPVLVVTTDTARAWDSWADHRGGVEVRRKPIDYDRIRGAAQALCSHWGQPASKD